MACQNARHRLHYTIYTVLVIRYCQNEVTVTVATGLRLTYVFVQHTCKKIKKNKEKCVYGLI